MYVMKKLLSLLFLASAVVMANAQTNWKLAEGSKVTFVIKNAGFNVDGKFGGLSTTITFDKQNPTSAGLRATVQTATIDTDNGMRDGHLKKEEYFDVAKHPTIIIQSTSITRGAGNDQYKGIFNVTIKGVTKQVTIPFTFTTNGSTGKFSGSFTINRRDFKVGGSSWILSDKATVTLDVSVTG